MNKRNVNKLKLCGNCKHWDSENNICLAQDILECMRYEKCCCGDFNWSDEFVENFIDIYIDNDQT